MVEKGNNRLQNRSRGRHTNINLTERPERIFGKHSLDVIRKHFVLPWLGSSVG